jgi:hypothetical protein
VLSRRGPGGTLAFTPGSSAVRSSRTAFLVIKLSKKKGHELGMAAALAAPKASDRHGSSDVRSSCQTCSVAVGPVALYLHCDCHGAIDC